MKKWIFLHFTLFSTSFFILKSASAQTAVKDTGLLQAAISNAGAVYTKAIGQQSPLNNGPEYYFYNPIEIRGSAYFMDGVFTPGNVYYDGAEFKGVQLLYDLNKDQLAAVLYNHFSQYVLVNDRVQYFDLLGHHFINIDADTLAKNTPLKTGYYDELYNGRSRVLVKRYKLVNSYTSTTGQQEAYSFFTEVKQDLFIRKDNVYYKVGGQGTLLDVLKDRKKELQQYIKTNKIKYKADPERALAGIAAYYDSLTN
jgi:hypothetical protein